MKIVIGGDVNPIDYLRIHFIEGEIHKLMGEKVRKTWFDADIRIINLETPLVDEENINPILKVGKNFHAPTKTIKGIRLLKPNLVCLANNHIMDQSSDGLLSTTAILKLNHIDYIGAGVSKDQAKEPFIFEKEGIKVGVYNCSEREFNIVDNDKPGANPFDPFSSLDDIKELSERCDYVIVIYHAGKELYRYPSPDLKKICRKMVDNGADFVVTQHSHCIGSKEVYKNKTIVYGQGNFLFNYASRLENPFWGNGMIIKLTIDKRELKVNYVPFVTTSKIGIEVPTDSESSELIKDFEKRSENIKNEKFLTQTYSDFSNSNIDNYLYTLAGFNKWVRRFDKKLFNGLLLRRKYNKKKLLAILNSIQCEAHRELLLRGIKNKIYND